MTRQIEDTPPATVIPTGDVVVLREDELDTDLTTAIARVRADEQTRRSRILIVRNDELPAPETATATSLPPMPISAAQFARQRERATLEALGLRLEALVECLAIFSDEATQAVEQLDEDAIEAPRARLHGQARRLAEILGWSREVVGDLRAEAQRAAVGMQPVELGELVVEASRNVEALFSKVRVEVESAATIPSVPARAAELVEALFLGIGLVSQRIGGCGNIRVSHRIEGSELSMSIVGYGEPKEVHDAPAIERFRGLIEVHAGRVTPHAHGAAGTGLVLTLPVV